MPSTNMRQIIRFGRAMSKVIGKHHQYIGNSDITHEQYCEAQRESDEAASLIKYMICHLENDHMAKILASAAGCPGYFNYRGRM